MGKGKVPVGSYRTSWLAQKRKVQNGESLMVRFDTTTRWQREKSSACGRPCSSEGRAAHQTSACPASVPLLPVMRTSVRFQPPIIGSYPVLRSSHVWAFAPSVPCGPRHSTLQAYDDQLSLRGRQCVLFGGAPSTVAPASMNTDMWFVSANPVVSHTPGGT